MPEVRPGVREVFDLVTQNAGPKPGALMRQEARQRRAERNRKLGTQAVVLALIAALVAVFTLSQRTPEASKPTVTPLPPVTVRQAEVVGLDGKVTLAIPGVPSDAYELTPSPVGDLIALVRYRNYTPQIATMTKEGTRLHVLTHGYGGEEPAWSPDGSRIAFAGLLPNANHAIFVMNANGSNLRRISNRSTDQDWPAWSPDGTRILYTDMGTFRTEFSKTQELWTVPSNGGFPTRLTHNHVSDTMGSYSPDGARIVWVKDLRIWTMNSDGSNAHAVPGVANVSTTPVWSPDGARIAFLTLDPSGLSEISVKGFYNTARLIVEILDVASGKIAALPLKVVELDHPTWLSRDALLVNALTQVK